MSDYIKRSDAIRAMAQYMMDTALIDNPEASDRIEEWEGSIAEPVMSTVKAADVVEVVRCKNCKHRKDSLLKESSTPYFCTKLQNYTTNYEFCSYGERA